MSKPAVSLSSLVGLAGVDNRDGHSAPGRVPKPPKRLFTIAEAGTYLGRSSWSIRRLIWNGELPSVRAGGRVHIDVRDMDDFIEKHKITEM